MKKKLVLLVVTILVLSAAQEVGNSGWTPVLLNENTPSPEGSSSSASVSGGGSSQTATMFFDRTITGQQLDIFNTYGDTATHNAELDLLVYQVAGWRLSDVQIDTESITAAQEKEVVGETYENLNFQVSELAGTFYSQIGQGFYNFSHNGVLVDYSIYYITDRYVPALRGNASLVVRSGNQIETASDITAPENLTASEGAFSWVTVSAGNATLSASTLHWVVVDGRQLQEAAGNYPAIFWTAEDSVGTYPSMRYDPPPNDDWDTRVLEALLNYTYIPWNQTANAPLTYSSPQEVDLKGNSSVITSFIFSFSSSTKNITSISFDTNQSVYFDYNMTLSYIKETTSSVSWEVTSSGSLVDWSVVVGATYPSVTGQVSKYLNISKASSWTITGFYESVAPTTNHTDYSVIGTIVKCASMTDGTWRLAATSFNHLSAVNTFDSSNDSEFVGLSSILVDVDVNLTILEQDSDPVNTGLANLTIVKDSSVVWSPSNKSVSGGKANYLWNIDSTTSDNGAFTIEVSWANGTDAGYLVKDLVVYYPTSLTATDSDIDAFTESTFEIRVYFEDTFTPQGLYGAAIDAVYSFDGGGNTSMSDHSNGTWTASIPTTGKNPGTYLVDIYTEGFALENQSVQVSVNLLHDTESLTIIWSDSNNITYIETTELVVYYNRVTGSTPIPGAMVNVTINAKNWTLTWDGVSAYRITFNGTDVPPGFGLHNLTIEAWKAGHKPQSDSTQWLNIDEEPTSMTYEWSNGNDITYLESTTLIVNYTMSDGSPVVGAIVNVTIGSDLYNLTWNGATYEYVFDGDAAFPGFGGHTLTIMADKHGHKTKDETPISLTISPEPTSMTYAWSNGNVITYVESTTLIVNYTLSDGSPVVGATVNVTIGSLDPFILVFNGSVYEYVFEGDASPGIDSHSLTILADKHGHVDQDELLVPLTINEEPTTLVVSWSSGNNISYVGETYLIANYTMSNSSPVLGASVNVTIGAYSPWHLDWDIPTQTYRVLFSGADSPPGLGTHTLTIQADLFGFGWKNNLSQMTFREETTELVLIWSDGNSITFIGQSTLSANYTMENGTAIRNAFVNVSIGGASPLEMTWHEGSQTYRITLFGTDDPPGFGNHSVAVLADLFGYREESKASYLNITKEPTSIYISWSNGTTITYVQNTTLSVIYRMYNTTPIAIDANVTALIGSTLFNLTWNAGNLAYEITFNGTDNPPDIGIDNVIIEASKFGYHTQTNNTYWLTIDIELTSLELSWWVSDTISYVGNTVLYANFSMSDGSPVRNAYVNATIGSKEWIFDWNEFSKMYMLILNGNHPDIGVGIFAVSVNATLYGFDQQDNAVETLTVNPEFTDLVITWSNGNDLNYFAHTFLFVNYRMSNSTTITNATLSVTIDSTTWDMDWNETALLYQVRFNGSDWPPGVGTHNLTIQASKYGYISQMDDTRKLTLPVIPTSIEIIWSNSDTITYVEDTTLRVKYSMFNGTIIADASVYISIGVTPYPLTLIGEYYEYTFYGTDNPPGFGIHSTEIYALKDDFETHLIEDEVLTIDEEPTSFAINWSNGYNISYVSGTILSVKYQMSNSSPIPDAIVNVTINGRFWDLIWNPTNRTYDVYISGDEDPPGYGNHTVEIRASRFGYTNITNTDEELEIHIEETYFVFEWSDTITYVEHTKIKIFYLMSNGTPIPGALVNITHEQTRLAIWNGSTGAYEYTWFGDDVPPGVGSHQLLIRASKANYVGLTNTSQFLTINVEPTLITASWSNGNSITFVESTTLLVNYTTSNGTVIPYAAVDVTIAGSGYWPLDWNSSSNLYEITFRNESAAWPGLGSFGLSIRGWMPGYEATVNTDYNLTIISENVDLESKLLGGSTITYVGFTVLQVNYTTSEGVPIAGATVNVTVNGTLWDLKWHPSSETYRIQFNGSDSLPGFGTFNLVVNASAYGFDPWPDSLLYLTIDPEPTTLIASWGAPNFDSVTYFDYTILFVEYRMFNKSVVLDASVNVTIGPKTWTLDWNSTADKYSIRFNGSDSPPGFGTHVVLIDAALYGYVNATNSSSLTLTRDPTTIDVSWTNSNNITYVEYTVLSVVYRMSNGSDILGATVSATIGAYTPWTLTWNGTAGAYQVRFEGNQIPPGLGTFTVDIQASASVFVAQSPSTTLTLRLDSPTVTPSLPSDTIDWTESVVLSFDFRDSHGTLIENATTKSVSVDSVEYVLQGTDGTYWIEFNNTFDLGLHNVWANFSKFGYNPVTALSISFTIEKALTNLTIIWSSTEVDYLEQIDLTVDYYYNGTGATVPSVGAVVNITIDGTVTLDLTFNGSLWIATFTRNNLSLGSHDVDIRAQVYGYEYSEFLDIVLTVNEIVTDALVVTWTPSNITIEYTDSLYLTVDYTFYGGDVPDTAMVNVSIDGRLYNLTYSGGIWSTSIPGDELGIGNRTATINAWLYGYQYQTDLTLGINVTLAANSFVATWEPLNLQVTFIDTVNLSVDYTEDYIPIIGATVELSINGTPYTLTYSAIDEKWHFSMKASDIGLGVWNVTVTANKTGYADGWDSRLLTISRTPTNLTVIRSSSSIFYDENITLDIYYQLMNTSTVLGATCTVTVDSIMQSTSWDTDHWVVTLVGTTMGLGIHSVVIDVAAFGYEPTTNSFDVTVIAIPTSVVVDDVSFVVYPFDSVTASFTWFDDKNVVGIGGYAPEVTWPDSYSVIDHGNGTYSIEVDNDALHVGTYELHVNFLRLGYTNGTRMVNIEIIELPIVLIYDDEIDPAFSFENETISVSIQMYDGPHGTIVDWGDIIIELAGVQYHLVYDSGTQSYSVDIWLSSLAPGSYTLNFTASAVDCETEYGEIQLEIIPKIAYTLAIEVDDEIQAGQSIQITILASTIGGPLENFPVMVHIIVERGDLVTQEFIEPASDSLEFNVPIDATKLTIWAEFEGAEGEWPAISNIVNREVIPGGMDILSFIISLFEDPVTLTIIVGGGVSLVGLIFLRRRRGRGDIVSTSIADPIIAPTSAPSAPTGEMEILQEEIRGNVDGLTRAQIAQSLEISTSKAGAMVKKLLESDTAFEEVKEGRLRRIRFRGEE